MLRPADHDVMSAAGFAVHARVLRPPRSVANRAPGAPRGHGCWPAMLSMWTCRRRTPRREGTERPVLLTVCAPPDDRSSSMESTSSTGDRWRSCEPGHHRGARTAPFVLVSGPPGELTAAAATVVACCGVRSDLAPGADAKPNSPQRFSNPRRHRRPADPERRCG